MLLENMVPPTKTSNQSILSPTTTTTRPRRSNKKWVNLTMKSTAYPNSKNIPNSVPILINRQNQSMKDSGTKEKNSEEESFHG